MLFHTHPELPVQTSLQVDKLYIPWCRERGWDSMNRGERCETVTSFCKIRPVWAKPVMYTKYLSQLSALLLTCSLSFPRTLPRVSKLGSLNLCSQ